MDVKHYLPQSVITFYTETGDLVARSGSEDRSLDDDVVSIQTVRNMGADAPTFYINLTRRKAWHTLIAPNDLVAIEMCRPPEVSRYVFIGLVDDCRKTVVMNGDGVQRVIKVSGRGVAKAFISFDTGHVPEVEYQELSVGWLQSNNVILGGRTGPEILSSLWENIAKRHINYKWTNGQHLFDVIKHDLKTNPGIILMDQTSLINWQGSVWSFMKEIADEPFNEMFWEMDNGQPTLFLRPTPFMKDEWVNLPEITITDDDVIFESVGRSDLETYTLFSAGARTLFATQDVYKTFGIPPLWHKPYSLKYGIRRLHADTIYAAVGSKDDLDAKGVLLSYREKMYNWNVSNNQFFNGTIVVAGSNQYKIGHRLIYASVEDGTTMEYYITSVTHNFTNFQNWHTELGVTRGIDPTQRFNPPYGAGTEYNGLGLVAYNPDGAKRALLGTEHTRNPISGVYLALSENVINAAYELMESDTVIYQFGGPGVEKGRADCSQFTQYIYSHYANMDIGRTTGTQVTKGIQIPKGELMAGDLVFFKNTYDSNHMYGVSHVGIYVGDGQFIHNSSGAGGITISDLDTQYWLDHWLMGRRVLRSNNASRIYQMEATAYGATPLNGGAGTGLTATGTVPEEGVTVAVDPSLIPLGSRIMIESDYPSVNGVYIAEDTGGAIQGYRIDIYMNDLTENQYDARKRMLDFGRRYVKVTVLST